MPATTYDCIGTTTTSGNATSVNFSSIPATFTDLLITINMRHSNGTTSVALRFNGDTGGNYSYNSLEGASNGLYTNRGTGGVQMFPAGYNNIATGTSQSNAFFHIMNYASTAMNKTVLGQQTGIVSTGGYPGLGSGVGMWSSTAAINSVNVAVYSGNFVDGAVISLYGIKCE